MSVRIFQIGFNKCGTTTLARFFKQNGLPVIHWGRGDIARRIERAREAGEDPLSYYRDVVFFSDMMALDADRVYEGYKQFDYLHQHYPDALFILNTRNVDGWVRSRHNHGKLAERYGKALGLDSTEAVERYWRQEWAEHHARVVEFFKDKPGRLLVYNIEQDTPQKLVDFVRPHYKLDVGKFEPRNVSAKRSEKRRTKIMRYLQKAGRPEDDRLTADDRLQWQEDKLGRRRAREQRNAAAGKWVVKRRSPWRRAVGTVKAAVRRVFGR
jgi:hypothetical protein